MSTKLLYGTFVDLESALPGGFTGARLSGVTVRPSEHVIEFAFEVPNKDAGSVAGQSSVADEAAEAAEVGDEAQAADARIALVRVSGVAWIEFEPRDPKAGGKKVTMVVASDPLDSAAVAALGFPPVAPGAFAHRLYAQGTDGAMCFAAESATLEWCVGAAE